MLDKDEIVLILNYYKQVLADITQEKFILQAKLQIAEKQLAELKNKEVRRHEGNTEE